MILHSDDDADVDGEKHSHQYTIEEFTEEIDEAGFVGQCNFFYLPIRVVALMNLLLSVAPHSSSLATWQYPKRWYQGQDRLSDKSQWQLPSNRVSDRKAPTGTDRASHQAREPTEDDEDRLAMRQGDMPPSVPERVANPRIREDRAVQDFQCNSDTRAWFHYCRSVFPKSVRKASPDVDLYNVSTYQCSILFNNLGSFNRKSEFRKVENMYKPVSPNEKFNVTNDPQLSLLREFWGEQLRACDDYGFVGCQSSRSNDMSVHARIDTSGNIAFYGNQMMTEIEMQQSLMSSLAKRQREQPQNRASDRLSSSLTLWSLLR